ncbi:YhcG family protein [Bacteroides mediterraneensis]|uniref:PDDEXK nuclease domain-containing protein n=1 Tax=Bacteroides mediterraneensis TaxID=1841856 RepID=UPI0026EF2C8C|nr:PDDEXK nuclease domain-containing protein [Bacteroides mediterraneensis]
MDEVDEINQSNELTDAVQLIKNAILRSQERALGLINQEQLALYYGIGRFISVNTRNKNWGKGFVEAISEQLRKELPGLRGFSAPSLRKMRTFYEEWRGLSDNLFVTTNKLETEGQQNSFVATNDLPTPHFKMDTEFPITAFVNIGFTHHYLIVSKVKDAAQREFYIQFAFDTKARVEELDRAIKEDLYAHRGNLPNNFEKSIPDKFQAYRAITMFKDEYLLDFINVEELFVRDKDRDERVIEQSIVQNVKKFIMTFGKDFTFVGNQYHLEKYGVDLFPDLLFFNRELAALVCVELKDGPFKTSYLGQLAAYLRVLDDEVRKPNENPSIGIILCKSANKKFVEYVIQDYDKPMGVATYKTTADMNERLKKLLPSVEDLKKLL